jgi:hypothetical protein
MVLSKTNLKTGIYGSFNSEMFRTGTTDYFEKHIIARHSFTPHLLLCAQNRSGHVFQQHFSDVVL